MESINDQGEEYTELVANGVDIQSHQGVTYQIHHKYGIIDQGVSAADPMVFTGSHNWSSAAENNNDENTVFVHDQVVANQYYQEFLARYCELANCLPTSAPTALFSWGSGGVGVADFTDLSSNTPTSWSWDFGDGNTSTVQNPTNTFAVLDTTYYVCLSATNGIGSDTYCDSVYIDSITGGQQAPVASFSSVYNGEGVFDFTDLSTNTPTSWTWDFGDGNTSTAQNPTNTFVALDTTYYVCLTATNGIGSDASCDSVFADTVTVPPPGMNELGLRIAFTVYPNPSTGEFRVAFTLNEAGHAQVRVMDITARVLYNEVIKSNAGDNLIAISTDLNAGQYIFELTIDGVASFLPLIIE